MKNAAPIARSTLYLILLLLWGTGVLWLILSNLSLLDRDIVQASRVIMMQIHGGVAMLSLLIFGAFAEHIRRGLRGTIQGEPHRNSGWLVIVALALLIATAWMLYYVGNEAARNWASLIHWLLGVLTPVLIYRHLQIRDR